MDTHFSGSNRTLGAARLPPVVCGVLRGGRIGQFVVWVKVDRHRPEPRSLAVRGRGKSRRAAWESRCNSRVTRQPLHCRDSRVAGGHAQAGRATVGSSREMAFALRVLPRCCPAISRRFPRDTVTPLLHEWCCPKKKDLRRIVVSPFPQTICGRQELNLHPFRDQILSLARLPISPRPRGQARE